MSFKCPICGCQYSKLVSLSLHFRKFHQGTARKLHELLYHGGKSPSCACGCGEEVKFLDISRGFRDFVKGHQARVKNNWGHNKKAREKSQETRRKMFQDGELEIWNKGLTKEDHPSVAKYAATGSQSIRENKHEIEARRNRMKEGRLDGTVPTLHGPEHSQWRGGMSSLVTSCRKALYEAWTKPKLAGANFQCEKCESKTGLEVHHNDETFSEIMRRFAKKHKWEKGLTEAVSYEDPGLDELKKKIADEVADYHINNNVSGVVLCKSCHQEEHEKHSL